MSNDPIGAFLNAICMTTLGVITFFVAVMLFAPAVAYLFGLVKGFFSKDRK